VNGVSFHVVTGCFIRIVLAAVIEKRILLWFVPSPFDHLIVPVTEKLEFAVSELLSNLRQYFAIHMDVKVCVLQSFHIGFRTQSHIGFNPSGTLNTVFPVLRYYILGCRQRLDKRLYIGIHYFSPLLNFRVSWFFVFSFLSLKYAYKNIKASKVTSPKGMNGSSIMRLLL
tara:strand:+ start:127 stop:636 length:510 start_codon:yes stop_codon:yes gene_type:complete